MEVSSLAGLIRRLRLHSHVSEKDAQALLDLPFVAVSRDQYAHIVREGDAVLHCFVLISGLAERHRIESNGGKQILAIYIPGDPLNLDHILLDPADDGLQTLKVSELACIKLSDLKSLMDQRPGVAAAIYRALAVDSSIFREWTVNVGQRDARTRIAHLLCELDFRMRAQEAPALDLPLTQYQIAEATGLTPVHVNRTLRAMQSEGWVSAKSGSVRLPDWNKLRHLAGFDVRYLHVLPFKGQS